MKLSKRVLVPGLVAALAVSACSKDERAFGQGEAGSAGASSGAGAPSSVGGMNGVAGSGSAAAGAAAGGSGNSSAGANAGGTSAGGTSASGGSAGASAGTGGVIGTGGAASKTNFFVTSDTSVTANLGGLSGADARCQKLAVAAGLGAHTFHAYLSAEHDPNDASKAVDARDRIGTGPWYNSAGVLLAQDLTALHSMSGNASLFLDEKGKKINGQWVGSPTPNQHDVLTGSTATGTVLAGKTCADWTSSGTTTAQVGHADGLGPGASPTPPYNSWNSSHENGSCGDTAPKGGAGRLYCFAIN